MKQNGHQNFYKLNIALPINSLDELWYIRIFQVKFLETLQANIYQYIDIFVQAVEVLMHFMPTSKLDFNEVFNPSSESRKKIKQLQTCQTMTVHLN